MKLLVGLGNPGEKYARHRHNIGFMVLDRIADRHTFPAWRNRFRGEVSEGRLGGVGDKVMLLKPTTYMNESGRCVGEAARFYKIPPEDIIVFHDEIDLAPGKLRIKTGGGTAGHNGLRSISASPVGNDYVRVRMGVGHPGHKDRVPGYVLHDFAKADLDWLEPLLDAAADAAPSLADGEYQRFMSEVSQKLQPPKADKTKKQQASGGQPKPKAKSELTKTSEPDGPLAALKNWLGGKSDT